MNNDYFSFNTMGFFGVLAIIFTVVATVLALIFIVPEKKREKLNKLGQFINDVFNFKFLIIEKIMRALYVLSTIACIFGGFFMLFGISIWNSPYSGLHFDWYGIYGILLMILGPIAVRIAFEISILALLLVKNVIQINKKLKGADEGEQEYKMPKFKELISKENLDFIKKPTDNQN